MLNNTGASTVSPNAKPLRACSVDGLGEATTDIERGTLSRTRSCAAVDHPCPIAPG